MRKGTRTEKEEVFAIAIAIAIAPRAPETSDKKRLNLGKGAIITLVSNPS